MILIRAKTPIIGEDNNNEGTDEQVQQQQVTVEDDVDKCKDDDIQQQQVMEENDNDKGTDEQVQQQQVTGEDNDDEGKDEDIHQLSGEEDDVDEDEDEAHSIEKHGHQDDNFNVSLEQDNKDLVGRIEVYYFADVQKQQQVTGEENGDEGKNDNVQQQHVIGEDDNDEGTNEQVQQQQVTVEDDGDKDKDDDVQQQQVMGEDDNDEGTNEQVQQQQIIGENVGNQGKDEDINQLSGKEDDVDEGENEAHSFERHGHQCEMFHQSRTTKTLQVMTKSTTPFTVKEVKIMARMSKLIFLNLLKESKKRRMFTLENSRSNLQQRSYALQFNLKANRVKKTINSHRLQ